MEVTASGSCRKVWAFTLKCDCHYFANNLFRGSKIGGRLKVSAPLSH